MERPLRRLRASPVARVLASARDRRRARGGREATDARRLDAVAARKGEEAAAERVGRGDGGQARAPVLGAPSVVVVGVGGGGGEEAEVGGDTRVEAGEAGAVEGDAE